MSDFARLVVSVQYSGVDRTANKLDNLGRQGAETEARVTKSAATISKAWTKMASAVGLAMSAVFASGAVVRGIADFERSMSRVAAISGATGVELEALRQTAKDLGSTTEFSAGQAADALGFLSMAGFEAGESMAAIPAVLDLATAAGIELARSADIASNVLSGFGKSAKEAGNVADVLAEAASSTNTSVEQLGRAMSTVAPISAALGISMETTAASIGVMSDAGIQGERAGTALRGVLSSLAGPTSQAQEALAKYGLTAADVNPEAHGLSDIMSTLAERGLTTADAMTIFGREAASGALVMVEASQRVGELTGQFEAAGGAASAMAATVRDNLGGDLNSLKSSIEGLILAIGDAGLTKVIRFAVQALTELVRGIKNAVNLFSDVAEFVANFGTANSVLENAIDNSTIAMGDQIVQTQKLSMATGQGNAMSLDSARLNLMAAQSRWEEVEAIKAKNLEIAKEALGINENNLAIARAREELEQLNTVRMRAKDMGVTLPGLTGDDASLAAEIENADRALAELLATQQRLVSSLDSMEYLSSAQQSQLSESKANVEKISAAIDNAVDGMVMFEGEVVTAHELTERLKNSAAGIHFDGAITSAQKLASSLSISVGLAQQIARVNSGGAATEVNNNGLDANDPRNPNNTRPIFDGPFSTVSPFDPTRIAKATGSSGGGGASGAGGTNPQQAMSALDSLLNGVTDQTPREKVEAWHTEVMDALAEANLIERGMMQEHADYKLDIERLYQDQLTEIQAQERMNRLKETGSFFGAMAALSEAGGAKLAKIAAISSGAQTMIAAYETAMKAAAEAKTIPGRLAAYGMFVAKGVQTVQAINKAGSVSTSTSVATAGVAATQGEATPERRVAEFQLRGNNVLGIPELVESLNDAAEQGYHIKVNVA